MLHELLLFAAVVSPFAFVPWLCLVLPGVSEMLQIFYPFVLFFLLVSHSWEGLVLVLVLVVRRFERFSN